MLKMKKKMIINRIKSFLRITFLIKTMTFFFLESSLKFAQQMPRNIPFETSIYLFIFYLIMEMHFHTQ